MIDITTMWSQLAGGFRDVCRRVSPHERYMAAIGHSMRSLAEDDPDYSRFQPKGASLRTEFAFAKKTYKSLNAGKFIGAEDVAAARARLVDLAGKLNRISGFHKGVTIDTHAEIDADIDRVQSIVNELS